MLESLLMLALTPQANAPGPDSDTGAYLVRNCRALIRFQDNTDAATEQDTVWAQGCISFVDGFVGGLNFLKRQVCVTAATKGTVARVYVAYMDRHPKYFDRPPSVGLAFALAESYRCPAK